jgi:hypothetical protein
MGAAADLFGLVARRDLEFDSLALNLDDLGFGVDLVADGAAKSRSGLFLNFRNFTCQRTQISSLIRTVPSLRGALRTLRTWGGMRWTRRHV